MIRKSLSVAALLLAAACSKAPEDVTAHYSVAGGRATITAKAAANGDALLDAGPQTLLHKNGVDYIVITENGERSAISFADFIAANAQLLKDSGSKPQPNANDPEYEAVEVGEEKVADQKGAIWRLQPKGNGAAGQSLQLVVSGDPAFGGIAKAVLMQAALRNAGIKQLTGQESSVDKQVAAVLGKGMLLRMGDVMTLQDVAKGPIPASDFALPKVLDKATLLKRMTEARDKALAEAKARSAQSGATPPAGSAVPAPDAPVPAPAPVTPAPAK